MKKLKIITGRMNKFGYYWVDYYIARAFRKLGHTVDDSGSFKKGLDLGLVVPHMRYKSPYQLKLDYPIGFWGIDCTSFRGKYKKIAKHYDVIFVDRLDQVEHYKKFSRKAVYMPFGCYPSIHNAVPAKEIYDIGFVGRYAANRAKFLKALQKSGLKVKIHWSGRKDKYPNKKYLLPWPKVRKIYSQCRIIFNSSKDATNKRVFEGMSIGKLMLTRRKGSEPDNLFEDGVHLAIYNGSNDIVKKAKYYIAHPEERRAVALAGHNLVREKHKWIDRVPIIIKELLEK